MSQLTITISDKADALIAQLQKEIFNRRRKKVTAEGVVATLIESGAKSQSDKRFATSWKNLIADIERAAKAAQAHGSKPGNLSDEEWALVLSHRTRAPKASASAPARKPRSAAKAKAAAPARSRRPAAGAKAVLAEKVTPTKTRSAATARPATKTEAKAVAKPTANPATKAKPAAKAKTTTSRRSATASRSTTAAVAAKSPAKPATRKASTAKPSSSSVARRMAKAASRLGSVPALVSPAATVASPSLSSGALSGAEVSVS
jgi:hypothetical protein